MTRKWLYKRQIKQMVCLIVGALIVGGVVGALTALFGRVLLEVTSFREKWHNCLIWGLPLAGVVIVKLYQKWGSQCERGMGLLFQVGHETQKTIPIRLVPLVMGSTWLTHLVGGSAGREGVAVQVGGTIGHFVGKKLPGTRSGNILLVTGMAAGFAGLFRTPMAATFFALEVLVAGELRYEALIPSVIASFVASEISGGLGLEKFTAKVTVPVITLPMLSKTIFLGIVLGMCGMAFAKCLSYVKKWSKNSIPSPIWRIVLMSLVLIFLLFVLRNGRYTGLGINLIMQATSGRKMFLGDFWWKGLLTILTLAAGFQGGEVTPLFAIGASLGSLLGEIFSMPLSLAAALGYATVFGSATNTFLAPVMIGAEVFGYETLPYFFVAMAVAYSVNAGATIYGEQKSIQGDDDSKR